MVEKLSLNTEKHPQPYKLSWLHKGNEVRVDKRCLVHFSIVPIYKDEVWCDVIPMDACHLLLGRPWQYDRKVVHDGYKNTYTFEKDGEKITLDPEKERKHATMPESVKKKSEATKEAAGTIDRSSNLFSSYELLEEQAYKHRMPAEFKEGDLVRIRLCKERRYVKMKSRADGPFKVLQRINNNAYKVEFPGNCGTKATFNIVDLSPYHENNC